MRVYFDTEFTGLHKDTTLISIGLIDENGRTFYAELNDYDKTQVEANDWLKENVVDNLIFNEVENIAFHKGFENETNVKGNTEDVKVHLTKWFTNYDTVEIWSDCLAYDWVLFNNIFGGAMDIPKNIYYIPFDLCTLFKLNDIDPDISREEFSEIKLENAKHNALFDAIVIKECHNKILTMTQPKNTTVKELIKSLINKTLKKTL